VLVLAMIALPIVGVSAMDVTIRSSSPSAAQEATRQLGHADARLSDAMAGGPIYQGLRSYEIAPVHSGGTDPKPVDVHAAVPPGARVITDTTSNARVRTRHGLLDVDVRELKATDPLARGIMTLLHGHFPADGRQIAVTSAFLDKSGLRVGDRLTPRGGDRSYTITGSYELPDSLTETQIDALPGTFVAPLRAALIHGGETGISHQTTYLVGMPGRGGYTWPMVERANASGVYVDSRDVRVHPPAASSVPLYVKHPEWRNQGGTDRTYVVTAAATIAGMAMLEICLLAGPAFAVGARRSRRQLGLVGASGGDRRHIRAIVLSGGLVIGAAAAVTGLALGLLLTVVFRPMLENAVHKRFGSLVLRPTELGAIAALAVVTGLLAAIVPAVTASRESVLASLTGRRGIRHANRLLPVAGVLGVALGVLIAVAGSTRSGNTLVVAAGSSIAELGVVALTPVLVGAFGRLGRVLPLTPRLALRDAVRNRGRTAPAVAAVLAAVAGTVAVATYTASTDRADRDSYIASMPYGSVTVTFGDHDAARSAARIDAAVAKELPVGHRADAARIVVGRATCSEGSSASGCGTVAVLTPKANACPLFTDNGGLSAAQRLKFAKDWRCAQPGGSGVIQTDGDILVGGPAVLHALGVHDAAADRALAAGRAVSLDRTQVAGGRARIGLFTRTDDAYDDNPAKKAARTVTVPVTRTGKGLPVHGIGMVLPTALAKRDGLRTQPVAAVFTTTRMPSDDQRQALDAALDHLGVETGVYVERGYQSKSSVIMLALALFAGIVTVGAAGIATGLAQADAEADLKTLAAVGAPPAVRRSLSGFQCGVVAAMGVVLGGAAGVLPAIGLLRVQLRHARQNYRMAMANGFPVPRPHVPIVVPWGTLGLLLVAVPVGAALLAALVTRSSRRLARRAAV
jgi:putative ABC transport system permease protein